MAGWVMRNGKLVWALCTGANCGGSTQEATPTTTKDGALPTTQTAPAPYSKSGGTANAGGVQPVTGGNTTYQGASSTGAGNVNVNTGGIGKYQPDYVEDRMKRMMADDSMGSYMDVARTNASQEANSRGLLNSSMAVGEGEKAAVSALLPIAQTDSGAKNQFTLNDQAFDFNSALQNAQEANKFLLGQQQHGFELENLSAQNTYAKEQMGEEFKYNSQLNQQGYTEENKRAYATFINETTQQYQINRTAIMTDPNLDEAAKNKRLAELDMTHSDALGSASELFGFDVGVYGASNEVANGLLSPQYQTTGNTGTTAGATTNTGTGGNVAAPTGLFGNHVTPTTFDNGSQLTEEQAQMVSQIPPEVANFIKPKTGGYTPEELAGLSNINASYMGLLDPSKKYTPQELSAMGNVDDVWYDYIDEDLYYSPSDLGKLANVTPVFANYLPIKAAEGIYTPTQLSALSQVDTRLLGYLKPPDNKNRYEPDALAKLAGFDVNVLISNNVPTRVYTPTELASKYATLAKKYTAPTGVL